MSASVAAVSGVCFTQALSTPACTPQGKGPVCHPCRSHNLSTATLLLRRKPQEMLRCVAGRTYNQGIASRPKVICSQRILGRAVRGSSNQQILSSLSSPLTSSYAYGGGLPHRVWKDEPQSPNTSPNPPPITAARKDRRRDPWRRDRAKGAGSYFLPVALLGFILPALVGGAALATTIPTVTVALGFAGFVTMASLTATFALIAPLLIFFIPVFGFPLGLFFGLFGGLGGGLRTVVDFGLTLAITSNFVSALLNRAKRKQAEEPEEEKELPLGEQIKRMALAEVEKGLRDLRTAQFGSLQQKTQTSNKSVKAKENPEEVAVKRANEAQDALREVASPSWWAPTALSLVPGLNGLAWLAATEAFPTAVQGDRQKSFQRNALTYGAPALLYLLAAPFQGVSLMGFMRGEAWWLSLVFGLVHLQLERKDMVEEARARAQETALPEPDELARATKELQEFDRQLSNVAWSSERPSRWTEANVTEWLKDEGLERLVGTFNEHHIDGSVLLTLQQEELREELEISSLGDRKRVLAAIARLQTKELGWDARVVQELDA